MIDDVMNYYLLASHEAELIACFRMLSEPTKDVIASMVASQAKPGARDLVKPVELSLVRKP